MSILTHDEILKAIESGEIKIEPYDESSVGVGSIDLRLGNKFRVFKRADEIFEVNDDVDYQVITDLIEAETIVLQPGETVLAITQEKITLSPRLCGWLEGRTRFARLGLMVHISASFMQPGVENRQVLEISNMGHVPLRLHAGTHICQFIFEKTVGEAKYQGRFKDQTTP